MTDANQRDDEIEKAAKATRTAVSLYEAVAARAVGEGRVRLSMKDMVALSEVGAKYISSLTACGIDVRQVHLAEGRSIVVELPHASLVQDVSTGAIRMVAHEYVGSGREKNITRVMQEPVGTKEGFVNLTKGTDVVTAYRAFERDGTLIQMAHAGMTGSDPDLGNACRAMARNDMQTGRVSVSEGHVNLTRSLELIDALRERDIEILKMTRTKTCGPVFFTLPDGVLEQTKEGFAIMTVEGQRREFAEGGTGDVNSIVTRYIERMVPEGIVRRAVQEREAAAAREDAERNSAEEKRIIDAYRAIDPTVKEGIVAMLDYIALGEARLWPVRSMHGRPHGPGIMGTAGPASYLRDMLSRIETRGMPEYPRNRSHR